MGVQPLAPAAEEDPVDDDANTPERLREALVDEIAARSARLGRPLSPRVEAALRTVPRHLFLPGRSLERAYADIPVVTRTDSAGLPTSSVSQPAMVATMLDQLRVEPGHRVLEIGSGGYNAALLSELVGPAGSVTTVDIDPGVTARARSALDGAGHGRVDVVLADGEFGLPDRAPFDRIVVTVGTWDIPPAWPGQLARGGRIVAPLRLRGLTRSLALEPDGGHLVSRSDEPCGFVPMQGAGESAVLRVPLHGDEVGLLVEDGPAPDAAALADAAASPRVDLRSGVVPGPADPFTGPDLWLATALPGFCLLTATPQAVARGLVRPAWTTGTPALAEDGGFAYLGAPGHAGAGTGRSEFVVHAHGRRAGDLAARLAGRMRDWDRDHRSGPGPVLTVHPTGTPDRALPDGFVIDKRHTRVVVTWP
ncbi:methyltransferase, FxLD system [Nocardiopsis tropica]|uniref:Protein-L-isoaspartate O-methyltransferase n=1 Tax=Nocardiopsis tropica TaxID=109330 RepID=A0ABV1ZTP5_9ACTN